MARPSTKAEAAVKEMPPVLTPHLVSLFPDMNTYLLKRNTYGYGMLAAGKGKPSIDCRTILTPVNATSNERFGRGRS